MGLNEPNSSPIFIFSSWLIVYGNSSRLKVNSAINYEPN
jgi:hypothetical protein